MSCCRVLAHAGMKLLYQLIRAWKLAKGNNILIDAPAGADCNSGSVRNIVSFYGNNANEYVAVDHKVDSDDN